MNFIILVILRFSQICPGHCSTIVDISEGASFQASQWQDEFGNDANLIYTCTEQKAGPYLGGFTKNFRKTFSNLPPHYQITLSVDVLLGQYWNSIGNYFQILADGSQIYRLSNINTLSFDWPTDYCKSNQFYGFSFPQQYYTINMNFNHQNSNLLIQFQGTFDLVFYILGNVFEQVSIKNLVIQTQDCDQSCLTCSGPSSNQCLTCQQGTPTNGICSCSTGYIYQNGCVTNCPTYYVAQNNICQLECSLNCNTCSQSQCTSCIGYNVGGTCFSSCPAYSLNCVDLNDIPTYGSYYLGKYLHNLNLNDISSFSFTGTSLSGQLYSIYNQQLILGGFGVWGQGQFSISYTNINPHNNIRIYAQLYFIDQWNGENIQVIVDGVIQYTNTFTSVLNTNNIMYRNYGDQISNIQLSVPHLSDTISIIFKTSLNQNSYSASAGITNLFILADYCDSNCQICGTTQCTTCSLNYNLIHNRCTLCDASTKRNTDCSCLTSYFDDGTNQQCQQCSSQCLQCSSLNVCTTCSDNNKVLPLCTQCKPGYYLSGTTCNLCNSSCQTCQNGSSCILCAVGKQFNADGFLCSTPLPVCQSNQFINSLNLCETCGNQCLTCTNNSQNCQTCTIDRINPPSCQCKSGYYSDTNNSSCLKCSSICLECENSQNNCTLCAGNRINIPNCDCPSDGVSRLEIGFVDCSTCEQSILQIQFSDDLSRIMIDFGKQLYQYQNCINLFSDITKFGLNPSCKINSHLITLFLGQGASINVGDVIKFNLINFIECTQFSQLINNKVQAPTNSLSPIIQFDSDNIQSLICEDITINIINIQNNGQRDLIYLGWMLNSMIGEDLLQNLNQQMGYTSFILPGNLSMLNQTIQLTYYYQNFIGQLGQTNLNVQVVQQRTLVPKLLIPAIYTYLDNIIYVLINQQVCNESLLKYKVTFSIYNNETIIYNSAQESQSYSTSFTLHQSQFSKEYQYDIIAQLTYNEQQFNLSDTFTPQDSQDYVIIKNGDRQVGFRQDFNISVQTSLDSNDFQWGCFIISNNRPCDIELNNSNTLIVKKSTFQVFQLIQFTVTQQNIESKAIINMIDAEVPQINVNIKPQYISRINNYYDELYFEIDYPIKIIPELLFYYINLQYEDQSMTFRVYYYQFKFKLWDYIGNQTITQLNIQFNVFNPDYSVPSTASIRLYFNIPPQNCQIQFSDQIFNVLNCKDEDRPLQYQFVYYTNDQSYYFDQNKSIIIQGIILQEYSTQSSLNFTVPQNSSLIMIQVKDNFQGISNLTIKVNQSNTQQTLSTIIDNQIDVNQLYLDLVSYLLLGKSQQSEMSTIYNLVKNSALTLPQRDQLKYLLYKQMNVQLIDISSDYSSIGEQINVTVEKYKQLYSNYNYYNEVQKLYIKSTLQKQAKQLGLLYNLNLEQMNASSKRRLLFESQNIITQVDQIQSALISSSLANEESQSIQTDQFNTSIIKLTSSRYFDNKGNSSSIYQFGETTYLNNPLQNTSSFSQFKQEYNTKLYVPTLVIDGQQASNYPSNYSFDQLNSKDQQCIIKINNYWSADACSEQKQNESTVCVCQQVSPITIVQGFQQIKNSIEVLFTSNAIDNISNLQVEKLAFTYIVFTYTMIYIALVWIGNKQDANQIGISETKEDKMNKIHPIKEIQINEEVFSERRNNQPIRDQQQIGFKYSLKFLRQHQSMKQLQLTENEKEESQKEQQLSVRLKSKTKTKISFQPEEEKQTIERFDLTDVKSQFITPDGIIRIKNNINKIDEINSENPEPMCLNSQIQQSLITEAQAFKIFYIQWHELISVYHRYDKNQSRIHRSTLIYISNIGQICILTVFGKIISISTLISLSILQGVFRFLFRRIIQYLLNNQNSTLRVFGGLLVVFSSGMFFYLILASIAAYKDVITANLWAASYIVSFILNYLLYSSMGLLGYYVLLRLCYKNSIINKILNILLEKEMIQLVDGQ